MTLHLVTPGFRPHFILRQLKYLCEYSDCDFIWHIIMDSKISLDITQDDNFLKIKDKIKVYSIDTIYTFGFEQRNYFTETLSLQYNDNDWMYFLDDDNLPSPDVFDCWLKYRTEFEKNFVLMSQIRFYNPNKRLYGRIGHASLGKVDIGNFICRLKIIKGRQMNSQLYNYDGHLVEELKKEYGDSFAYEEAYVALYNVLHI